jgi:NAD(P)H-dependent FMN reductase
MPLAALQPGLRRLVCRPWRREKDMVRPRIAIIIGTTRQGRFGERPAAWLHGLAEARRDADYDLVDLRDYPMPLFDEPKSPAAEPANHPEAVRFREVVARSDGFVLVTAEYNHGIPASLKNAMDHVYAEWGRKPAAFVSYGGVGGARAVEQLRLVCVELQLAPLRNGVGIGRPDFGQLMQGKDFGEFPALAQAAGKMLDDLIWWTQALKAAREADAPAG